MLLNHQYDKNLNKLGSIKNMNCMFFFAFINNLKIFIILLLLHHKFIAYNI